MSDTPLPAEPLTFEQKLAKSTQLKTVTYDPTKQVLSVIFQGSPGWVYDYAGVKPSDWAAFQKADSLGSHHHYAIKGKFPFTKRLAPIAQPIDPPGDAVAREAAAKAAKTTGANTAGQGPADGE